MMKSPARRFRITVKTMLAATHIQEDSTTPLRTRRLDPPRAMTGTERRLMNPNRGLIKICDRYADIFISRFIYPLLDPLWNPYSWQLQRRFGLAETRSEERRVGKECRL